MVDRFRRRSDAEAHLRVLKQITPDAIYEVIFDSAYQSGTGTVVVIKDVTVRTVMGNW